MTPPCELPSGAAEVKEEVKEEDTPVLQTPTTGYQWSSTTVEEHGPDIPTTWGVAFNYRPSVEQYRGHAQFWKRVVSELDAKNGAPSSEQHDSSSKDSDIDRGALPSVSVDTLSAHTWRHMFATVNGGMVRVYLTARGTRPRLLRSYTDPHPSEALYAVTWTFNADNRSRWWVLAAGERGLVRVIDPLADRVVRTLAGHGGAVNDLAVHPRDGALVATASKDESLRLWNIRTGATIAVFCGLKGHRGEVVCVDFDADGRRIASCGIDNSVRVWDVAADSQLVDSIVRSHRVADREARVGFPPEGEAEEARGGARFVICQFPRFISRKLHKNYIDCVMWVGDLLLSKSVHNRLLLIEPRLDRESLAAPAVEYTVLQEYAVNGCNVWFIRFGMDRARRTVAIGNDKVRDFACALSRCCTDILLSCSVAYLCLGLINFHRDLLCWNLWAATPMMLTLM